VIVVVIGAAAEDSLDSRARVKSIRMRIQEIHLRVRQIEAVIVVFIGEAEEEEEEEHEEDPTLIRIPSKDKKKITRDRGHGGGILLQMEYSTVVWEPEYLFVACVFSKRTLNIN
jgi:hypothetical protein